MATQLGTAKKVAGKGGIETVVAPAMESFVVGAKDAAGADITPETKVLIEGKETTTHTYQLKHAPIGEIKEIYVLNADSTFGEKYIKEVSASATAFSISGQTITLPVNAVVGTELFIMYEYNSENAVEVVNSAKDFPVGCKFVMEVLGCDVCDQTNLVYAYVIFNNFKLSPDFDWSIATDGSHPFSGKAQQDYCDKEKRLFSIVIPGDEE